MSDTNIISEEAVKLKVKPATDTIQLAVTETETLVEIRNPDLSPDSEVVFDSSISSSLTSSSESPLQDEHSNPATRGATSVNKRSKRPQAKKPSSALLEAKRQAQQRMKIPGLNDAMFVVKDHLQAARDSKDVVRKPTGLIYDTRMVEHRCLWDEGYPEKPERFAAVIQRCEELGLLQRCLPIQPRLASREELLRVHTEEHIDKLLSICQTGTGSDGTFNLGYLEDEASMYDAIYFHPSTYELSLLATGCTVDLVHAVATGIVQNGMAIIRPPGHHAMKSEFCGYCYFNNVAVAAKIALDKQEAERILIVDFDVHHGQATQQQFYDDPRVLYFSTHRFEHGMFWPNLPESNYNFVGHGKAQGFNINVPLNNIGLGNPEFLSIWHHILLPVAYKFNPDLIIVSAGYDAAVGCFEFCPNLVIVSAGFDSALGDEKGEMDITPQCYPHLISPLLGLAGGRLAVVLEGGYCIQSLAEGAALSLRTLLGDPCPMIQPIAKPEKSLVETVLNLSYMLQPFWKDLSVVEYVSSKEEKYEICRESGSLHVPEIKFKWDEPKPQNYLTRDCYPLQSDEKKRSIKDRLDALTLTTSLNMAPNRVCISYNDLMLKHRNIAEPGHPEKPDRISTIFACHSDYGLLERSLRLPGRYATEDELRLVHTAEHVALMKQTASMSNRELYRLKEGLNSVYFNQSSYDAAAYAAGSVLEVVDTVLNGVSQSGIAIVRPPGHHAEADEACGFCLFNNVALAAKYALDMFALKRILLIDWDVHHGNGIQRMFKEDSRVLYVSLHRYDYGTFFPCSEEADSSFVGELGGEGFNVNIPWNKSGIGDTEYLSAFAKVILPIAYEFNPELVLVSAGFDAARGDPLGGCRVSPEGYAQMTHLLSSLANGKVILALEGGYNLTSIAYSMTLCTKALFGDPIPTVSVNDTLIPSSAQSIQDTVKIHSQYWTVLRPFVRTVPLISDEESCLIPLGTYDAESKESVKFDYVTNENVIVSIKDEEEELSAHLADLKLKETNALNNNDATD